MNRGRSLRAVVFDLDGVLVQTEELWHEVREGLARERGGGVLMRLDLAAGELPQPRHRLARRPALDEQAALPVDEGGGGDEQMKR